MDPAVDQILDWAGFTAAQRPRVADNAGLVDLTSFDTLDKDGVGSLAESLRRRTPVNTRVHVSKGRQDYLLDVSNWVGDFIRRSRQPAIPVDAAGNNDNAEFERQLGLARSRAKARKHQKEGEALLSEAAKPTKLKDEKNWREFDEELQNYLCTILGVNSVPLAYLKRLEATPDHATAWDEDQFQEEMIACAPLNGPAYKTDNLTFHLLLWKLIDKEDILSIIRPLQRFRDGRRDYLALHAYMMGPGNVSRRVGTAEALRKNLRYKNERAMKFATFTSKLRTCYTTLDLEGRPVAEPAKIDDLLAKLEAPYLAAQKANLQAEHARGALEFEAALNVLASTVASSSEATSFTRSLGEVGTEGKKPTKLRRLRGGGIDTEYTYSKKDFKNLSKSDLKALFEARDAKKEEKTSKRDIGEVKISEIVAQAVQASVQAMQSQLGNKEVSFDASAKPADDAGMHFGGRAEKKAKK